MVRHPSTKMPPETTLSGLKCSAWGASGARPRGRALVQQHLDEGHAQAEHVTSRLEMAHLR